MTRFLTLIILLASISFEGSAQDFRLIFGVGPNFSRGSYQGLNFVLNRYNETRQGQVNSQGQQVGATLTRPMGNITSPFGVSVNVGINVEYDGFILNAGFGRVGKRASTYAEVTDVNNRQGRRDIRFTANSYNFDGGIGARFRGGYFLVGASTDFFSANVYTRTDNNDYVQVMDDLNIGMSLFADVSIFLSEYVAFGIKPYMQFGLLENDFSDLNKAINSSTAARDSFENQRSKSSNIGLQLFLRLHVSTDY